MINSYWQVSSVVKLAKITCRRLSRNESLRQRWSTDLNASHNSTKFYYNNATTDNKPQNAADKTMRRRKVSNLCDKTCFFDILKKTQKLVYCSELTPADAAESLFETKLIHYAAYNNNIIIMITTDYSINANCLVSKDKSYSTVSD